MVESKIRELGETFSKGTKRPTGNVGKGGTEKVENSNDSSVKIGGDNSGDISVNITTGVQSAPQPETDYITPAKALQIKKIVSSLVEKEVAEGAEPRKAYTRWWRHLNSTYNVSTYREIPRDMGDDAVDWLEQQAPKISSAEGGEAKHEDTSHKETNNIEEAAVLRAPREEKIIGHSQQAIPSKSSIWSMIRRWFR